MSQDFISIQLFNSPEESPVYREPEYNGLTLHSAVVVGKGTVAGNPTVDLILVDEHGQKFVALVKGSYLEAIGAGVAGMRARSKN